MRKIIVGFALVVGLAAHAQVVINELYYDSPDIDAGCFTELYGTPGTNLSGWSLVGINGFDGTTYATINLSGTVPGDGFFVVAQDSTVPNYDLVNSFADWQNGADNVLLYDGPTLVDAVGYGSFGWTDTFFFGENLPCPDAWAGASLIRTPDGHDTQSNIADLRITETPTPGTSNTGALNPVPTTIYGIQYTTDPGGNSPLDGLFVSFNGVVSSARLPESGAINAAATDGAGPWHGVIVYSAPSGWTPGDSIQIMGEVSEYQGKTEVTCALAVYRGAAAPPSPNVVQIDQINTGSPSAESYEGTLCRVLDATVSNDSIGFGEWEVTDGFENLIIDNRGTPPLYSYTPINGEVLDIAGIVNYTFSNFKLAPRSDEDIVVVSVPGEPTMPSQVVLEQNAPNPFNPATTISFVLPENANVSLDLYNVLGQRVATLVDGPMPAGRHSVAWDAGGAPSGVYFYRLRAGGVALARSMVLAK